MRRTTHWVLLLGILLAASVPSIASADILASTKVQDPAKLKPTQELWFATLNKEHAGYAIHAARSTLHFFQHHPQVVRSPDPYVEFIATSEIQMAKVKLKNHLWLLGYASRVWKEAYAKLHPELAMGAGACSMVPASFCSGALCVHNGEGSWRDATGNGFFGGLQFDYSTWLSNGGGRFASRADLATPAQQVLVAYWTWQRRGWQPWPNTARACGLL